MNPAEIQYRPARFSDHSDITDFQLAMARETEDLALDRQVCELGVKAVFEDAVLGRYHVCEVGGKVVGSALLTTEWSDWRNGVVWWIHSVYFLPSERGKRLFSGFYGYIQELARANPKVRGLRLYVDRTNTRAQSVYTKLGMDGDHYRLFEWMKPD